MKLKLCLLLLILSTNISFSQVKSYFVEPDKTNQILPKYTNAFSVAKVVKKEITVPKYNEVSVVTDRYNNQLLKLKQLEKDSIRIIEEYEQELVAYEKQREFIDKLNEYMASPQGFKDKSHLLEEAQTISDQIQFGYELYSKKPKRLSSEQLTPVIENAIQRSQKPALSYNANNIFEELSDTKNYLKKIPQFESEYEESGTETIESYISTGEKPDLTLLNGQFDYVYEDQFIITRDHSQYVYGQIVGDSVLNNPLFNKRYTDKGILFFNQETSEYFFDTGGINFFFTCGTKDEINAFAEKLKSYGYDVENTSNGKVILVNSIKLKILPDIYEQVSNGNTDYPKQVANSVNEFTKYMKQAEGYIQKLANHYSAYSKGTMGSVRLANWKSDFLAAQKIESSYKKLPAVDNGNWYNFMKQIDNDLIKIHTDFTQVLQGTRVILGM